MSKRRKSIELTKSKLFKKNSTPSDHGPNNGLKVATRSKKARKSLEFQPSKVKNSLEADETNILNIRLEENGKQKLDENKNDVKRNTKRRKLNGSTSVCPSILDVISKVYTPVISTVSVPSNKKGKQNDEPNANLVSKQGNHLVTFPSNKKGKLYGKTETTSVADESNTQNPLVAQVPITKRRKKNIKSDIASSTEASSKTDISPLVTSMPFPSKDTVQEQATSDALSKTNSSLLTADLIKNNKKGQHNDKFDIPSGRDESSNTDTFFIETNPSNQKEKQNNSNAPSKVYMDSETDSSFIRTDYFTSNRKGKHKKESKVPSTVDESPKTDTLLVETVPIANKKKGRQANRLKATTNDMPFNTRRSLGPNNRKVKSVNRLNVKENKLSEEGAIFDKINPKLICNKKKHVLNVCPQKQVDVSLKADDPVAMNNPIPGKAKERKGKFNKSNYHSKIENSSLVSNLSNEEEKDQNQDNVLNGLSHIGVSSNTEDHLDSTDFTTNNSKEKLKDKLNVLAKPNASLKIYGLDVANNPILRTRKTKQIGNLYAPTRANKSTKINTCTAVESITSSNNKEEKHDLNTFSSLKVSPETDSDLFQIISVPSNKRRKCNEKLNIISKEIELSNTDSSIIETIPIRNSKKGKQNGKLKVSEVDLLTKADIPNTSDPIINNRIEKRNGKVSYRTTVDISSKTDGSVIGTIHIYNNESIKHTGKLSVLSETDIIPNKEEPLVTHTLNRKGKHVDKLFTPLVATSAKMADNPVMETSSIPSGTNRKHNKSDAPSKMLDVSRATDNFLFTLPFPKKKLNKNNDKLNNSSLSVKQSSKQNSDSSASNTIEKEVSPVTSNHIDKGNIVKITGTRKQLISNRRSSKKFPTGEEANKKTDAPPILTPQKDVQKFNDVSPVFIPLTENNNDFISDLSEAKRDLKNRIDDCPVLENVPQAQNYNRNRNRVYCRKSSLRQKNDKRDMLEKSCNLFKISKTNRILDKINTAIPSSSTIINHKKAQEKNIFSENHLNSSVSDVFSSGSNKCHDCKKQFENFQDRIDHDCLPFSCEQCQFSFKFEHQLKMHKKSGHSYPFGKVKVTENMQNGHFCAFCGVSFITNKSLLEHKSFCKKRQKCKACGIVSHFKKQQLYCAKCRKSRSASSRNHKDDFRISDLKSLENSKVKAHRNFSCRPPLIRKSFMARCNTHESSNCCPPTTRVSKVTKVGCANRSRSVSQDSSKRRHKRKESSERTLSKESTNLSSSASSAKKHRQENPQSSAVDEDYLYIEDYFKLLPDDSSGLLLKKGLGAKCLKCNKICSNLRLGSRHFSACKAKIQRKKINPGDLTWICTTCHLNFSSISELNSHKRQCKPTQSNGNSTFQSDILNAYFEKCGWCSKCGFTFVNPLYFTDHQCVKRDRLQKMQACSVTLNKLQKCNVSIQDGSVIIFECSLCQLIFYDKFTYDIHNNSHLDTSNVSEARSQSETEARSQLETEPRIKIESIYSGTVEMHSGTSSEFSDRFSVTDSELTRSSHSQSPAPSDADVKPFIIGYCCCMECHNIRSMFKVCCCLYQNSIFIVKPLYISSETYDYEIELSDRMTFPLLPNTSFLNNVDNIKGTYDAYSNSIVSNPHSLCSLPRSTQMIVLKKLVSKRDTKCTNFESCCQNPNSTSSGICGQLPKLVISPPSSQELSNSMGNLFTLQPALQKLKLPMQYLKRHFCSSTESVATTSREIITSNENVSTFSGEHASPNECPSRSSAESTESSKTTASPEKSTSSEILTSKENSSSNVNPSSGENIASCERTSSSENNSSTTSSENTTAGGSSTASENNSSTEKTSSSESTTSSGIIASLESTDTSEHTDTPPQMYAVSDVPQNTSVVNFSNNEAETIATQSPSWRTVSLEESDITSIHVWGIQNNDTGSLERFLCNVIRCHESYAHEWEIDKHLLTAHEIDTEGTIKVKYIKEF